MYPETDLSNTIEGKEFDLHGTYPAYIPGIYYDH